MAPSAGTHPFRVNARLTQEGVTGHLTLLSSPDLGGPLHRPALLGEGVGKRDLPYLESRAWGGDAASRRPPPTQTGSQTDKVIPGAV